RFEDVWSSELEHIFRQSRRHQRVDRVVPGEVVEAVERNGRPHTGVSVLEARLKLRIVRGEGGQRRQMPTGRAASDGDPVRVAAVLGDVLLDPGQRTFDIDNL